MLLHHGRLSVFLLCFRRIAASAAACNPQEVPLESMMQTRVTHRRGNSSSGRYAISTVREDFTALTNVTVTNSKTNGESRTSLPSLEDSSPRQHASARKLGSLQIRAMIRSAGSRILGFDMTDLLLMVIIIGLALAGLFLLWGGSPEELRQHPWQAIEQRARESFQIRVAPCSRQRPPGQKIPNSTGASISGHSTSISN